MFVGVNTEGLTCAGCVSNRVSGRWWPCSGGIGVAELFTHVVAAFAIVVVLSWQVEWITPPMVPVAMVGAAIPDLNRMRLVVPNEGIEAVLGIPCEWGVVHRAVSK